MKKQPKIWLITDTHFGHDKMVEYCGRPKDHSYLILNNLEKAIKPGDTLIHLGDFCIGEDEKWMRYFHELTVAAKTILVRGNHDHKSDNWYITHGFDAVVESFVNTYFGKKILFSHIPQKKQEGIDFNVHGHFHNADHRRTEPELQALYDHDYHKLLAIENTGLQPVLLETFLSRPSTIGKK